MRELRNQIASLLVQNSMPTRQVFISQMVQLFREREKIAVTKALEGKFFDEIELSSQVPKEWFEQYCRENHNH